MSSRSAVKPHVPATRTDLVAIPVSDAKPTAQRVEAAANDEHASAFSFSGDPLIGMAIGTIILFGVLAALMAFA